MTWLLIALAAAAPKLEPISAPFGYAGRIVTEPGAPPAGTEKDVTVELPGCSTQQTYHLTVLVNSALEAVKQLQPWLDKQPGLEHRLFGTSFKLADLQEFETVAIPAAKHACKAPPLGSGFQLPWTAVPKLCDGAIAGPWGDHWWTSRGTAAIAVALTAPRVPKKGAPAEDPPLACRPRFSVVLFDAKGNARLKWNAEYLGELSVSLLAEKCQQVDFTLDVPSVAFVPVLRTTPGCR
ncbi:MAG: hypothetical protein QM723_08760 [Myxococcaceae bacterium]